MADARPGDYVQRQRIPIPAPGLGIDGSNLDAYEDRDLRCCPVCGFEEASDGHRIFHLGERFDDRQSGSRAPERGPS